MNGSQLLASIISASHMLTSVTDTEDINNCLETCAKRKKKKKTHTETNKQKDK